MIISVRVTDEEGNLIKAYAERKKITVSHLLRSAVQERLENEYRTDPEGMEVIREEIQYTARKPEAKKRAVK